MPVRKVSNRGGNIIGTFPSFKMAKPVPYESTIERDLLFFLEFEPTVTRYEAQPFTIEATSGDGVAHSYTPDFEVARTDRHLELIECKPAALLQVEHTLRQIEIGQNWASKNAHTFLVITDTDLRTGSRLTNLKILWRYRQQTLPGDLIPQIRTLLQVALPPGSRQEDDCNRLSLSFQTLTEKLVSIYSYAPATIPAMLYHLLFQHLLCTDLDNSLNSNSKLWFTDLAEWSGRANSKTSRE